jgi:ATP-dependent DNA helicase RecG
VKGAERRRVLAGFADGSIPIAIGTHALFQEGVQFRDLALAVVDEQHRFGVAQRLELAGKGAQADMLVMTATPIPRTLQLTQWGEMQVSRIEGKPAGRQPITTRIVSEARLGEVIARMATGPWPGASAPIGSSAPSPVPSTTTAWRRWSASPPSPNASPDRSASPMASWTWRCARQPWPISPPARTQLLVATTVIEVGVDVPEATIILIEQAERFGLSALHQLRGRVGRGTKPSSCLLIHSEHLSEREKERLLILRDTEDGFVIAEEDLRLRGGGEALGTRQAGQVQFRLGLRGEDEAAGPAPARTGRDRPFRRRGAAGGRPQAASPRGRAARLLLRIFGKADAAAFLQRASALHRRR